MALLTPVSVSFNGGYARQEPETLRVGQSSKGVSVRSDGKITFKNEVIGYNPDASSAQAVLYPPSSKKGLLYINHSDLDWGGLQGSIVDPSKGMVLVKAILPEDRVRGQGKAERVIQICENISWSPNEDYLVLGECGEVQRHIVVVDLAKRLSHIVEVDSLERDDCDWQHFEIGSWVNPSVYKFQVVLQKNPWSDRECSAKRLYPTFHLLLNARTLELNQ